MASGFFYAGTQSLLTCAGNLSSFRKSNDVIPFLIHPDKKAGEAKWEEGELKTK